jgi:hypothetical protein
VRTGSKRQLSSVSSSSAAAVLCRAQHVLHHACM